MKYVVKTQVLENYGAHCENGKFSSGNAYWKAKGGEDYIVSGCERPQDAMAYVMAAHSMNNIAWKEFPISVQTEFEWHNELSELDDDYRDFLMKQAKTCQVSGINGDGCCRPATEYHLF